MKKLLSSVLIIILTLSLAACGGSGSNNESSSGKASASGEAAELSSEDKAAEREAQGSASNEAGGLDAEAASGSDIDVDLTALSSTMVYGEVYNMLCDPDQYMGKRIRMQGGFASYFDEAKSKYYTAVIISDATACCQQGMEFVWRGHSPLDGFPKEGTELTVSGIFESYEEDGNLYCRISADEVSVVQ